MMRFTEQKMQEYEIKTINLLKKKDVRFYSIADEVTASQYSNYCDEFYAASWLDSLGEDDIILTSFCEWFFNSPYELIKKGEPK